MRKLSLITLLLLALAGISFGDTVTGYLPVWAYLVPAVSVEASALNFGNFSPGGPWVNASATISVNAPVNWNYWIALNAGQSYDGSYRRVTQGASAVWYYLDKPAGGGEWGDSDFDNTYGWGSSLAAVGTGAAQAHNVDGYLFTPLSGGGLPAGWYTDTVTITVYY